MHNTLAEEGIPENTTTHADHIRRCATSDGGRHLRGQLVVRDQDRFQPEQILLAVVVTNDLLFEVRHLGGLVEPGVHRRRNNLGLDLDDLLDDRSLARDLNDLLDLFDDLDRDLNLDFLDHRLAGDLDFLDDLDRDFLDDFFGLATSGQNRRADAAKGSGTQQLSPAEFAQYAHLLYPLQCRRNHVGSNRFPPQAPSGAKRPTTL